MKYIIRAASLFLVLLLSLSACRGDGDAGAVMSAGDYSISEDMYRFLFSTYKARYLSMYEDARDTAEFWQSMHSSGVTNEEWMNSLIRDSIRMYVAAGKIFSDEGLSLPEGSTEQADSYIDSLMEERCGGSRKDLEAQLAEYGGDVSSLREMLLGEEKMSQLFSYYFGDDGVRIPTDEERDSFYLNNYVRFVQINVNDVYAYVEQDGSYVQDQSGKYMTRALTDDERRAKESVLTEIDARIAAGEPLEELYGTFSENKDYPGGYYFSEATAANYDEQIVSTAFSLGEGEQTKIHTEHGTFYIKRLPPEDGGYALTSNADFFSDFETSVRNSLYDGILKAQSDEITVDKEKENALSVTDVKANYDLY